MLTKFAFFNEARSLRVEVTRNSFETVDCTTRCYAFKREEHNTSNVYDSTCSFLVVATNIVSNPPIEPYDKSQQFIIPLKNKK